MRDSRALQLYEAVYINHVLDSRDFGVDLLKSRLMEMSTSKSDAVVHIYSYE